MNLFSAWVFKDESFLSLDNFIELFLVQVFCSFFTFYVFGICSRYRGTFFYCCVAGNYVWYLRKCKNTKEIRRNRGFTTKKKKIFFFNFFSFNYYYYLDFVYLTWPFFSSLKCLCGFLMFNYLILYYYVSHMGANHANHLSPKHFPLMS